MEGTRHERAVTILSAYCIGFVTAFIAFGVTQLENAVEFVYVEKPTQAAAVIAAKPTEPPTLFESESGLMLTRDGVDYLLSAKADGEGDGFHVAITQYELSPDNRFVYFCEQPTTEVEGCKPFVYDIESQIVYPLTADNDRIAVSLEAEILEWGTDGLLSIGDTEVDPLPE